MGKNNMAADNNLPGYRLWHILVLRIQPPSFSCLGCGECNGYLWKKITGNEGNGALQTGKYDGWIP